MTNELQKQADVLEKVIVGGDLKSLSPAERISFYNKTCESLKLNPLTRPFEYITLNGKLTLYARKDATEQLRTIHGVSITNITTQIIEGSVYIVTVHGILTKGRADVATGCVSIGGLKGDALANAFMKAETKAKRRLTLSICGLGMLDETEIETIPGAVVEKDITPEPAQQLLPPQLLPLPTEDLQVTLFKLRAAHTLEDLKKFYTEATNTTLKNDPIKLKQIVDAKNARKKQLEAELIAKSPTDPELNDALPPIESNSAWEE